MLEKSTKSKKNKNTKGEKRAYVQAVWRMHWEAGRALPKEQALHTILQKNAANIEIKDRWHIDKKTGHFCIVFLMKKVKNFKFSGMSDQGLRTICIKSG